MTVHCSAHPALVIKFVAISHAVPEDLHVDHLHTQTVSRLCRAPAGCSDCSPSSLYNVLMACIVSLQKSATRVTDTGEGRGGGLDLFKMRYVFRKRTNS